MASSLKNLSDYQPSDIHLSGKTVAIVVSSYHEQITGALCQGAADTLFKQGLKEENLLIHTVPGAFELTLGAQFLAQQPKVDAIICLGCVIQGETKHFDFICDAVAHGITQVGLSYNKPVIFGVLTPDTLQQALDRAGGKHGNKGVEAAAAAIQMIALKEKMIINYEL